MGLKFKIKVMVMVTLIHHEGARALLAPQLVYYVELHFLTNIEGFSSRILQKMFFTHLEFHSRPFYKIA
jgi:hypothetical protein